MKNNFQIVAYATEGSPYVAELAAFEQSCLPFGYEPYCKTIPSFGGWQQNTQAKARFLQAACSIFCTQPIVYLDADSRLLGQLTLFENTDCDFAAHWFRDAEMISACMFLRNDNSTWELLSQWRKENERHPDRWDQRNLQAVVERAQGLNILRLPPEYNWIDGGRKPDLSEREYGPRKPVVLQTQASRRYRHQEVAA